MMFLSVNICSLHDLPLQNPACSSRSLLSRSSLSLFRSIAHRTFPGTDSSVIPRQLLQLLRSPFFGSLKIMLFLHSSGTVPEFQTMLNRWQSSCAISGPPCFSTSGVMLSIPGALLFFSVLIAF